jgi:hypothetical protein
MSRLSLHYLTTLMLAGLLFLSGCSSVKYEQDFKPGTEFSRHQSFAWRTANSEIDSADKVRLRRLAQAELERMGYRYQAENADLLIDISALTRISTGRGTGVGLSVGMPVGRSGAISIGGSKTMEGQNEEGVIIVDITDNTSNTLIWRGSAASIPLRHFSLSAEEQLSSILKQLLAQFPPE